MGCGDACPVFPGKRYLDWEPTRSGGKSVDEIRADPRLHIGPSFDRFSTISLPRLGTSSANDPVQMPTVGDAFEFVITVILQADA